jgi:hypothetical protein
VSVDDDREPGAIREQEARRILRQTMRHALDEIGRPRDLTEAIEAPASIGGKPSLVPHAFEREFALMTLSPDQATAQFLVCGAERQPPSGASHYEALFRFRRNDSAVLGLLWVQEDGRWRLKSFRIFEG